MASHQPRPDRADRAVTDPAAQGRFRREARLLESDDSGYVVLLIESGMEWEERVPGLPEFAYFVMEKGKPLDKLLENVRDPRERLAIFREACLALHHLHDRQPPTVHRDLKPSNFLMAEEPRRVVLADLGIAYEEGNETLTEVLEVVGSRFFRAHEVLIGERGTIASDVYSMGRMLEWILTEKVPQHLEPVRVASGDTYSEAAATALNAVMNRAAAHPVAERFSSVEELIEALPRLHLDVAPAPPDQPEPTGTTPSATLLSAEEVMERLGQASPNDSRLLRDVRAQVRSEYTSALTEWRETLKDGNPLERQAPHDRALDVLRIGAPSLALALATAVFHDGRFDMTRAVEDLMTVPGWPDAGSSMVIESPQILVFALHHLVGAAMLEEREILRAVQIARTRVRVSRAGASEIWHTEELTWAPSLLGKGSEDAWRFLVGLEAELPWLKRLFPVEGDYTVGLYAYNATLSLMELVKRSESIPSEAPHQSLINIPPHHVLAERRQRERAYARTFADREAWRKVAVELGADPATVRAAWPVWKTMLIHSVSSSRPERFIPPGFDLGELG